VPSRRRTRGWRIPSPRTRSRATVSIITRVALAAPSERAQRAEITICVSEVERTARMGRRRSSFHAAVGPIRARGPHVDRRGPAWVPSSRAPHPGNEGPARAGVPRGSGWRLRGAGIRDSRREAPVVAHQASGDRVRQTARTKLSVLRPVWRARTLGEEAARRSTSSGPDVGDRHRRETWGQVHALHRCAALQVRAPGPAKSFAAWTRQARTHDPSDPGSSPGRPAEDNCS
jgi:hypothetical protein